MSWIVTRLINIFNNYSLRKAVREWIDNQQKAESKYGHISTWDTSYVTNMSEMFAECRDFNQDISGWDVSQVTDMSYMFIGAYAFNQAIGQWDVSQVTDMSYMFHRARAFNQDIICWNVSKVTDMSGMFGGARAFNQAIGKWDVSQVTRMSGMFRNAFAFNQDIRQWNVSQVTDMYDMFHDAKAFNQNIGQWDTSQVTNMSYMFAGVTTFNQYIGQWNVSQVTNMSEMFWNAAAFNQDIGQWPIREDCDINRMFIESGVSAETFEGIYGKKIANHFKFKKNKLMNPDEDAVWEPYTRWERRKNAVIVMSSLNRKNAVGVLDLCISGIKEMNIIGSDPPPVRPGLKFLAHKINPLNIVIVLLELVRKNREQPLTASQELCRMVFNPVGPGMIIASFI